MKKIWSVLIAFLLSVLIAVPVMAESQDMWATVYKDTGKIGADGRTVLTEVTTGITYRVLATGADTDETITSYGGSTSKTNPVTSTVYGTDGGLIKFRTDPTDSTYDRYVDLIVRDNTGGFSAVIKNFDKYTHTVVIDERPGVEHTCIAWFSYAASSAATSTGVTFPINTYIKDARVEVVTADPGITINVGTSDTAAGFRTGLSLASTGFVKDTGVITNGSTLDYTAASTYGSLLVTAITGSDAVASGGGKSYLGHVVKTAGTDDDLYYTLSSSGTDTAAGFIYITFTNFR